MRSEFEKKWIIQQFGRTSQPSSTRRAFLMHFNIRGRLSAEQIYKSTWPFSRALMNPETESSKNESKRTKKAVENVKNFVPEISKTSLQKFSPEFSFTKITLWRIMRKDLGKKILPLHFILTTKRCSEITRNDILQMDSWAFTRHRQGNRVDRRKIFLPSPIATPEEWWSLGWRNPSSPLWNEW